MSNRRSGIRAIPRAESNSSTTTTTIAHCTLTAHSAYSSTTITSLRISTLPTMSSTEAEPRLSQPHASTASLGAKVAGVTLFGVTVKTYQNLIQKRHPLSGESCLGARECANDYWSRTYWSQIRSGRVLTIRRTSTPDQRGCLGWYRLPVVLRGAKTVSRPFTPPRLSSRCLDRASWLCEKSDFNRTRQRSKSSTRFFVDCTRSSLLSLLDIGARSSARCIPSLANHQVHKGTIESLAESLPLTSRQQLLYKIDSAKLGAREAPRGEGQSTEQGTALPS